MKTIVSSIVIAMGFGCMLSCNAPQPVDLANTSLIPAPVEFQGLSGSPFPLNEKTPITYSDPSLRNVAQQLSEEIKIQTGLSLSVESTASAKKSKSIFLELNSNVPAFNSLPQSIGLSAKDGNPADERYALRITSKGVQITATSPEGVYRGISSLRQLINSGQKENTSIELTPLEIIDGPKIAWRGLSLDVSRYFSTAAEVKKVIDMLALYKMNVLHFHITDNQGWRLEIKKYPKLTEVGSEMPNGTRKGGYYTQEEYKDLVQYAADRFITIVPEIDMPGHTAAVFASYPELKNAVNLKNVKFNIPGQALGALEPSDEKTMQFVEDVLTELAALTPGSYIHIGGDETFGMPEEKFIDFINKVRPMVHKLGKKMVGWQETSRADVGKGDLLQHWIYLNTQGASENSEMTSMLPPEVLKMLMETFAEAAHDVERGINKNTQFIMSPSGFAYLDHRYKESSADPSQTAEQERLGMPAYPKQTVEEMFKWDPINFNPLIKEQNIAGVEAAIWCETIESFSDLQFLILPRLFGVAEKGWSGNTEWEDYRARLATQSPMWDKAGWNYFKSSLVDWK